MLPKTYSVQQTADLMGFDRKTIERLIREGHLHAVDATPWGKNRKWIVTEDAIAAFLRGEKPPVAKIKTRKSVARPRHVAKNPFPTLEEVEFDGK